MNDDRMNIPTIPICPPKKDTIIIRPTGCSNNKNYIAWNDIKNKPFQNIDKTFFSVDTSGNITLSKDLNNNINYLNITVNEIKADSNIQSDWNQNDETKKDYIKNRPGGYYDEITTTTLAIDAIKQDESDKLTDVQVIEDNFRNQDNIDVEIYDSLGVDYRRTLTQRLIPEYVINEFGAQIYGNAHLIHESQPDTGEDLAIFKEENGDSTYGIGWHIWAPSLPSGNLSLSVIKTEYGPIPFPSDFIPWKASPTADSVLYTAQSLTDVQQAQARANIGAGTLYTLPQASSDAIGGVKADSAEAADTQPVRIGSDGKLYTAPGITDISTKMDANNPVGTGSFSMNRKAGTQIGTNSHAEGRDTTASGRDSHAEGEGTTAKGQCSHAEGNGTIASVKSSHAEGVGTTASGGSSHAEGKQATASGTSSHAEGVGTTAKGQCSHAEGNGTIARGSASHAEGNGTIARGQSSHVQGKYNIEDTSNKYADIIGNGASDTARSNAATVDWNGNAWFAGDVYTGSTSGTNKDDGSKKLATEEYVDNSIAAGGTDISLGLTSAAVGQIIKVKAIDESGKPTAWEAANMAGGEASFPKFEKLLTHTITEEEIATNPTAFMWNTTQIPNLNDFNVFTLTIRNPDDTTKITFTKWVRLKINNVLMGGICGTSQGARYSYSISANRLYGFWVSENIYNPTDSTGTVLTPPHSNTTFDSNLAASEAVTSIGFTSYGGDYGLTAGIVVEIWGAK